MGVPRPSGNEFHFRSGLLCGLRYYHSNRGQSELSVSSNCNKLKWSPNTFQLFVMDERTRTGTAIIRHSGMANRFGESIPDYEEVNVSSGIIYICMYLFVHCLL